jgi:hypothetical protein
MKITIWLLLFTTFSPYTWGEPVEPSTNALQETQDVLRDQEKRQNILKKDSKAKAADDQVQSLTGGNSAQSQEVYNISADAFTSVMAGAGNDPAKAMELLQKAQANPEAFYNSLPKDVKEKIRGVASDIEKKGTTKNSP